MRVPDNRAFLERLELVLGSRKFFGLVPSQRKRIAVAGQDGPIVLGELWHERGPAARAGEFEVIHCECQAREPSPQYYGRTLGLLHFGCGSFESYPFGCDRRPSEYRTRGGHDRSGQDRQNSK